MTTQWTGPEDSATARWEAEAAASADDTLRWARDTFPAASQAWAATERALTRHAHRTTTLAIATTAFISGALAALDVVAVAAGWHWLGAR